MMWTPIHRCGLALLCACAIAIVAHPAPVAAQGERPMDITPGGRGDDGYGPPVRDRYEGYEPPSERYVPPSQRQGGPPVERYSGPDAPVDDGFSIEEINETGHRFFGRVSMGLARVIEYSFSRLGRPNGYILGEEAGGALIIGLRYGEGTMYTRDAGEHKVFWQGPSLGYDFGAEGSKTMILVYNIRAPSDIYQAFAGVDGSAFLIGGVGLTFQTSGDLVVAPIRSGLGLRLGANVGYLKFTRSPTWNPF
jgi:hypothetical protein